VRYYGGGRWVNEGSRLTGASADKRSSEPVGLGGWLILVGCGLVLGLLRFTVGTLAAYQTILANWTLLASPQSDHFIPNFGTLVIIEAVGSAILIAAGMVVLFLFFSRSRRFPGLFSAFLVGWIAFNAASAVAHFAIMPSELAPQPGPLTARLISALLGAVIWTWYMDESRRVRNTFVR